MSHSHANAPGGRGGPADFGAIGSSQPRNKSRNPLTTDPRIGRARLGFPLDVQTLWTTPQLKKNFPGMSFLSPVAFGHPHNATQVAVLTLWYKSKTQK